MRLNAGTAVGDLTPQKPMALFGYPHVQRVLTGVHDPLLASVLYLANGSRCLVMIALDVLMLDPPAARALRGAVAHRLALPEAAVFISCTHTHSGPVCAGILSWRGDPALPPPDPDYLALIKERVVAAAADAAAHTRPASLAWTAADAAGVGGNRRSDNGMTDTEAGVLVVRAPGEKRPLALAVVYGMHPTVLHEDSTLVSSDFPHYTRLHLREQLGDDLVVLYHTAPAGNQSPRRYVQGQTFAEAERLGRKLGAAVADAVARQPAAAFTEQCPLDALMESRELPRRAMPSIAAAEKCLADYRAEFARLQHDGAPRAEVRTAECAIFGAEGSLNLAHAAEQGEIDALLATCQPAEVQALLIGDACLAGLPGELFANYALEIKRRAPLRTFPVSLVNGHLQGYVVTPAAAAEGGYEATNSVFTPESGAVLVDAALSLVGQVAQPSS